MLEHGLSGKHANNAMKIITAHKDQFELLKSPDFSGTINIVDVSKGKDINEHKYFVEEWAKSVWKAWEHEHSRIKLFAERNILHDLPQLMKDTIINKTGKAEYYGV
jgi:hypothetical protein